MTTTVTRRQLGGIVGLAGIAGTGLWLGGFPGVLSRTGNGAVLRSSAPLPEAHTLPFRSPPLAQGTVGADGVLRYELEQRAADLEILPGLRTRALTYAGALPGPTLVSRSGRRTEVTVRNATTIPTVTHLHGGHTPAESDGYPTDLLLPAGVTAAPVLPGMPADPAARVASGSRDHAYPMQQRAATLWYHDHTMAATAQNVWRGLFGMHLVHDDEEDALGLPSRGPRPAGGHLRPVVRGRRVAALPAGDPRARRHGHGPAGVPGRRARRRDPRQRGPVAGARGARRAAPPAAAQRLQRPGLPAGPVAATGRRRRPGPGRQRRRPARGTRGPRRDRPVPG